MDIADAMKKIGLFEKEKSVVLEKWEDLTGLALGTPGVLKMGRGPADIKSIQSASADVILRGEQVGAVTKALEW